MPSFPDNLVVFPDRDFITVEGYQTRIGQTATIEVNRPGVGVIGSAQGEIAEGDVAFEINHPGGYCWGNGTELKVTPDIKHGDEVSIKFDDGTAQDTNVQHVYVTSSPVLSTTNVADDTVTIKGHKDASVPADQMEQRIVEPALKDTSVGRRDARAVVGSGGDEGYTSILEFAANGTDWTATYVFDEPAAAKIAANAGAGVRALSWQETDVDGNRQGITINEFGEVGGPGMGGCPSGPLESGPVPPTQIAAARTGDSIKVTWTPAQAIPGTPAITGYRVHAVSKDVVNGEQVEIGKRISGVAAKGTTISGLGSGDYDVFVVSVSDAGETFPAAIVPSPQEDTAAPTVEASHVSGSYSTAQKLELTSSEPGAEIYFTTDGTDVIEGDQPKTGAEMYTEPIDITETTTVKFVAIDPSSNRSVQGEVTLTITNDPVPAKPAAPTAVAGAEAGTADVSWTAPDAGAPDLTITEYSVQAYKGDVKSGEPKKVAGDVTKVSFTGLTGDTEYTFTVTASNTHGPSAESDKSAALTVPGALVANAGPDQSITRARTATTVTLDGSKSTKTGATYAWTQTSGQSVTLSGAASPTATFSLPTVGVVTTQTAMAAINNPLVFKLTVTSGDQTRTDEVKVTPIPDRVTVGRAQWKSRDFRIEGTASTVGATVTVYRSNATGTLTRISGATVTAAVAPETGGVWSIRLRDNAAGTNPGTIYVVSSLGGTTTAPVTAG